VCYNLNRCSVPFVASNFFVMNPTVSHCDSERLLQWPVKK
jgi:hypothetical protein